LNITGISTISGETTINNNLSVTGTTTIDGHTTINDHLSVTGTTYANALSITDTATIYGATTINDNLSVTGTTTIDGHTTINDHLSVTGTTYANALSITDSATINGTTTINDNLSVTGTTTIDGHTTINDHLSVTGTTYANVLSITDTATIYGTTTINDNLSVTGTTTIDGHTTINDHLSVTGTTYANALSITDTATIYGTTTINDNLSVTGTTTIDGHTTINDHLSVTGTTYANALSITDTATIYGATTINDNLSVTGTTTIGGNTTITNNLSVTGTIWANALFITDTATIDFETTISDNLEVTGTTLLGGTTTINDSLYVTGTVYADILNITNTALINGATTINDNLSVTGTTRSNNLYITQTTDLAGNTTIGDSSADDITINAVLQGQTPLFFEGATADGFQTTIIVADPTEARQITIPDNSGTILLSGSESTMGTLTVTGPSYLNEVYAYTMTVYGDVNMLTSTLRSESAYITNAVIKDLIVDGTSTLRVESPTYITNSVVITTEGLFEVSGPNGMEVSSTASEAFHVTGNTGFSGAMFITGTTANPALSVSGTTQIQSDEAFVFEGTDSTDTNNTTFAVTEPSSANRITIPDSSGIIALKNFTSIGSSRTLSTSDQGVVMISSGTSSDITITLPDPTNKPGLTYTIKKTNDSIYSVAVTGYTIDGETYSDMHMKYAYLEIVSDGSNWYKIGEYPVSDDAPVPGNNGIITVSESDPTSVTLLWTAATDSWSRQEDLQYLVCYSQSYSDVNDFSGCESKAVANYSTITPTTLGISGLTTGATYYFNIIVQDEGEHKALYSSSSETPNNVIIYNAGTETGNLGGRTGADAICAASTNRPVTGFSNYHALMSFSASDNIADFATTFTTLKQNTPICSNSTSATSTSIASNWADLIDGTPRSVFTISGAMPTGALWWSGTYGTDPPGMNYGNYSDSCDGFTSSSATGIIKATGSSTSDTSDWLKNNVTSSCSNDYYIMCIAW
jgi:UDP-3-O-[3-hydroxymyristoyl] glucosamine N-acyltransferase